MKRLLRVELARMHCQMHPVHASVLLRSRDSA
jgi:hypothetical protein